MLSTTDDLRIRELKELSTPEEVMREVPRTLTATRVVMAARNAIHAILGGQDVYKEQLTDHIATGITGEY